MGRTLTASCVCAVAAAALRAATNAPSATTYYVSPDGNDATGDGSSGAPWATWAHAAAAVRPVLPTQAADVDVLFAPGVYALAAPVVLGAADSGHNGYRVRYACAACGGADGAEAVFHGGVALGPWTPLPGYPRVFVAALPCATRDAFVAPAPGAALVRVTEAVARGVNLTRANTNVTATGYVTTDAALLALAAAPGLVVPADLELVYTSAGAQWQEARCRVAAWALTPDGAALALTMAQPGWALVRGKAYPETLPTAVVNALVPGDLAPGQGVLSPSRGRVYFAAPDGVDMAVAPAWAAAVDGALVLLAGAPGAPPEPPAFVHDIALEGLTLQLATWLAPTSEGAYAPDQGGIVYRAADLPAPLGGHATHPVPAALTLRTAANVTLARVAVRHTGGTAIAIEGGSQDVLVSRAAVTDAGCSGVRLGQVDDAGATDARTFNARLTLADSVLTLLAQSYRDCSGVFGGFISNSTIAHNALSQANWAGVTLGWGGWGGCAYRPALGGNRIVGNAIAQVNLVTGDGGPIYVMAQQPAGAACGADDLSCRSEMAFNFVSYAAHHAAMLYHDEGTAFYWTHDNAVLQPQLTDPHGWWWSWAAAWADTESNVLIERNWAVGVNRSDMAAGHNLELRNNTLLPWGSAWPPAAAAIVAQAGPRPAELR